MGQVVKHLGNCVAVCTPGKAQLLKDAHVEAAIALLRQGKKVSVPVRKGDACLLLRRRKRNHFAFLDQVTAKKLAFEQPVFDIYDPIMNRHFLCTELPEVTPLMQYLASPASAKQKYEVLKQLFETIKRLDSQGLRHGDIHAGNLFVTREGKVLLTNPELDEELTSHLDADAAQLKNTLRAIERELNYAPEELWEKVKTTLYKQR